MNFYKFLEAVEHSKSDPYLTRLLRKLSVEDCVRFALLCAEDVLHLNNEQTMPAAQRCIDLVRQWLNNRTPTSPNALRNAADAGVRANVDQQNVVFFACYAASSAAWCAANAINSSTNDVYVNYAYDVASDASHANESGLARYVDLAQSFLSKTTSKSPMHKTFLQDPDIGSIAAFLDHAEEVGENIVLHQNNEFIFNMPGHLIRAKNKGELAEKILNDRWAMNYLKKLYR